MGISVWRARGLTLGEVMVSITLLSLMLVTTIVLFTQLLASTTKNGYLESASVLADRVLEQATLNPSSSPPLTHTRRPGVSAGRGGRGGGARVGLDAGRRIAPVGAGRPVADPPIRQTTRGRGEAVPATGQASRRRRRAEASEGAAAAAGRVSKSVFVKLLVSYT